MKKGDVVHEKRDLGDGKFYEEDYKVNWVIDDEAALCMLNDHNAHKIIKVDDPDFTVTIDSAPSFQSQVETMTDEELRASVESLRGGRAPIVAPAKTKTKTKVVTQSPEDAELEKLLATMSPQEIADMKVKLGL